MEWIPCSERLPREYSDDERVLATTDVDGLGVIIMPIYDVKSWYRKGYISAWMPLPKPYNADRKTENSSEIPNNCEEPQYEMGMGTLKCDNCSEYGSFKCTKCDGEMYFKRLEPKDEPQTDMEIAKAIVHRMIDDAVIAEDAYPNLRQKMHNAVDEYEPQTQLTAKCLNCNNSKACKEKHWDGCVYEPKDEKTCETCRHWKYIAHEWQCETCKCQGYEPKDEPQTENDALVIDMALAECKARHNGCKNCDKECMWRDEPQTDCPWK